MTQPAPKSSRKTPDESTPRTDATLQAMAGGAYSPDKRHPFYVLSAELEADNALLLRQRDEARELLKMFSTEDSQCDVEAFRKLKQQARQLLSTNVTP